ncbi:hypothetical protein TIFTF001_017490 [Ficus carica]|uniref:Uncharacterized protein n=1 Tax=Ficus carica TaxID=3494 RepID=A0AA88ACB3_FICCA|nr:hypothetical protein TIFTF001_017490 [Ficus carica]
MRLATYAIGGCICKTAQQQAQARPWKPKCPLGHAEWWGCAAYQARRTLASFHAYAHTPLPHLSGGLIHLYPWISQNQPHTPPSPPNPNPITTTTTTTSLTPPQFTKYVTKHHFLLLLLLHPPPPPPPPTPTPPTQSPLSSLSPPRYPTLHTTLAIVRRLPYPSPPPYPILHHHLRLLLLIKEKTKSSFPFPSHHHHNTRRL